MIKSTAALWPLKYKSLGAENSGKPCIQCKKQPQPVCLCCSSFHTVCCCCLHPLVVCSAWVHSLASIQLCSIGWISPRSAHATELSYGKNGIAPDLSGTLWTSTAKGHTPVVQWILCPQIMTHFPPTPLPSPQRLRPSPPYKFHMTSQLTLLHRFNHNKL